MYKDYKKKSKFFSMCESVQKRMDGVGMKQLTYVTIKKSVKSSDWYKNLTDEYKDAIEFLLKTDHNIRVYQVTSRPLGGFATENGEEDPTADKWVTVYDEMAIGLMGVTVTLPAQYVVPVEMGANRIPKIPEDWKYDVKIISKPTEVKMEDKYMLPKKDTKIPGKSNKGPSIKKAKKVN